MQAPPVQHARCMQCYRPLCAPSSSAPRAPSWLPTCHEQAAASRRSRGSLVVRHSAASIEPSSSVSAPPADFEPRLKGKAEGRQTYKPSSFQELVENATESIVAVSTSPTLALGSRQSASAERICAVAGCQQWVDAYGGGVSRPAKQRGRCERAWQEQPTSGCTATGRKPTVLVWCSVQEQLRRLCGRQCAAGDSGPPGW